MTHDSPTQKDLDDVVTAQVARLSVDYKLVDTSDTKTAKGDNERSTEVNQWQGNSGRARIKKAKDDQDAKRPVAPDPAVFTISFAVPATPDDHRFAITFQDERVIQGLDLMPASEIWHFVRDAIHHDPDIPCRALKLPWVTSVKYLEDKTLAFLCKTEEDLRTITVNVQWARDLRDIVSLGIDTYRVVFMNIKIRKTKTKELTDIASIINKIREENNDEIPSLDRIGAIRDVTIFQNRMFMEQRNNYADFIVVFGSREVANAALTMGLRYRKKKRTCVIYSLDTQWHTQCSKCQGHTHTLQDCQSSPACGRCGLKHLTQHCTSTKAECANCHGEHIASSKTCPKWLEAEELAHRCCRDTMKQDTEARIQTVTQTAKVPTLATAIPLLNNAKPQQPPKLPEPAQEAHKCPPPAATNTEEHEDSTPSALLQTIDEFRAFVAARETLKRRDHKKRNREEDNYVMSGALQDDGHEEKRIKMEEAEGPVWPIGQGDYQPPSLKKVPKAAAVRVWTAGKASQRGRE